MGTMMEDMGTVVRYEVRALMRNRAFLALAALVTLGTPAVVILITNNFIFWYQTALPCAIPATNAAVAGVPLSLLAMFAAGEWAAGERRADSLQALQVRPYGNAAYVTGKAVGIFVLLAVVAAVEALPIFVLHALAGRFDGWLYLFYWTVQTLPALAFMTGLAVWLHAALRHGFAAFIVLAGFLFADLWVLAEWMRGAWDFLGVGPPNAFSKVTGHVALRPYLLQRVWVALSGVAFVLLAVVAWRRADSSPWVARRWQAGAVGVLAVALGVSACYCLPVLGDRQAREAFRAQCIAAEEMPRVEVESHDLAWEQSGGRMFVVDTLRVTNRSGRQADMPVLWLNPGLRVEAVVRGGKEVAFYQEFLAVQVDAPLAPEESQEWVVRYAGHIDERACYLHVPDSLREATAWSNSFLRYGKHVAMVSDGYTFLTPECLWYPVGGAPYRSVPVLAEREFARFRLLARHAAGMTAVSQGRDSSVAGGTLFANAQPLAGLSLVVGEYDRRSVVVDSVLCEMYAFEPGGVFAGAVDGSRKGIAEGVRRVMAGMEEAYGSPYPFKRLAVVESPAALCSYFSPEGTGSGFTQPELLFGAESWCRNPDASSMQGFVKHTLESPVFGGMFTPPDTMELEAASLNSWFLSNFRAERSEMPPMPFIDRLLGRQWLFEEVKNPRSAAPLFLDYTGGLQSEEYPGVDIVIARPLPDETRNLRLEMSEVGMPAGQAAVDYLASHTLLEALSDPAAAPLLPEMLRRTGSHFRHWMGCLVGKERYEFFLEDWHRSHLFMQPDFREFAAAAQVCLGVSPDSLVRTLYDGRGLPVLLVRNIRQVAAEDTVCLVFDVWNPSAKAGLLTCYVQEEANIYELEEVGSREVPAGACGRMAVPLRCPCTEVLLHVNLSANLPATYSRYFGAGPEGDFLPVAEQVAAAPPLWQPLDASIFGQAPGEILVDNEDAGFRVVESKARELLGQKKCIGSSELLKQEKHGWMPSAFSHAWGDRVRSFYAKMVGNGGSRVEWTAELPEGGEYELYVYYLDLQHRFQRLDSVQYCYTLEQGALKADIGMLLCNSAAECTVSVRANDGYEDDFCHPLSSDSAEWIPLGCYALEAGKVTLKLYDRGIEGRLIFADAVKWVRR